MLKHLTIAMGSEKNLNFYRELFTNHFELKMISGPSDLISLFHSEMTGIVLLDFCLFKEIGPHHFSKLKEIGPFIPLLLSKEKDDHFSSDLFLCIPRDHIISKDLSIGQLKGLINDKITQSRRKLEKSNKIILNNFILFCDFQCAQIDKKKILLTPTEFKITKLFATNPNKIFNREKITQLIWPDTYIQNQNIDTHLFNLRKKLHPFSNNIKTLKSRGHILRI